MVKSITFTGKFSDMKRTLLYFFYVLNGLLVAGIHEAYARQDVETTIRQMEEKERQAVLTRDTLALEKIWSKNLMVNAPSNRVVLSGTRVGERPVVAQLSYSSFTREIEQLLVKGDLVFSMGNEMVVPLGGPNAGKSVKRRFTNVWMKEDGTWKLAGRHANVICQP